MPGFLGNGEALREDVAVCSCSVTLPCSGSIRDMSRHGFSTAEMNLGLCLSLMWLLPRSWLAPVLMDFEEQGHTAQQDGSSCVSYSRMLLGAAVTGAAPESLSPKRGN